MEYIITLLLIVLIVMIYIQNQKSDNDTSDENIKNIVEELNSSFKNLSNEVLVNQSDKSLKKMKNSLNELLDNFTKNQINSLNESTDDLKKEIIIQKELTKQISDDNKKFEKILSSPGPRGDWGELKIRTILELAGLKEGIHFIHNKKTETSKDRPDYVINLADGKKLILDSKFPFTAFNELVQTDDKEERKKLVKKHSSEVRKQMESLSVKEYWNQYKNAAPYIIMVLPTEELLYTAFQGDNSLYKDGVDKNVYLCSPLNLLAMMQVVYQGHTNINLNKNAEQVILVAKEILKQATIFNEKFKKIGYHGEKLVEFQKAAAKSLLNQLIPKLESLEEMGASMDKGRKIDPGIKMIDDAPYTIDEDKIEED